MKKFLSDLSFEDDAATAQSFGVAEEGIDDTDFFTSFGGHSETNAEVAPQQAFNFATIDERIKWLARTQKVNGSWDDDVELTAAALLAFVRAGHTTRGGSYRQQVRKAATWLQGSQAHGFPAFAAERALRELQAATGDSFDRRDTASRTNDRSRTCCRQ